MVARAAQPTYDLFVLEQLFLQQISVDIYDLHLQVDRQGLMKYNIDVL